MNVLLISSPYIELCLLECLDNYILENLNKVFLLKENHPNRVYNFIESSYSVEFVKNVEEGTSKSDLVLVIRDQFLSPDFISYINSKCINNKKNFILGELKKNNIFSVIEKNIAEIQKKPSVLIIGMTGASQLVKNERVLSSFLKNRGVNVFDSFQYSIKSFPKSKDLLCSSQTYPENADITFCSYDEYSDTDAKKEELHKYIQLIQPDCLIVSCDNSFVDYYKVDQHFYYNYGIHVDGFIHSNYCYLKANEDILTYSSFSTTHKGNDSYSIFCNDREGIEQICYTILTKVAYPNNVMPLN